RALSPFPPSPPRRPSALPSRDGGVAVAGPPQAATHSPRPGSGSPTTATSATPGCASRTFSISPAPILYPPLLTRSVLLRPTSRTEPSDSRTAMSPVRNQPSVVIASQVASGRSRYPLHRVGRRNSVTPPGPGE